MSNVVVGKVNSNEGFYIGDICYVLSDEVYHGFWGDKLKFKDGVHQVPGSDYSFAVSGTACGDGCYADDNGRCYPVDAGVIGLVPLELVKNEDGSEKAGLDNFDLGTIVFVQGVASFEERDGVFKIVLPNHEKVVIDTNCNEDDHRYPMDFYI